MRRPRALLLSIFLLFALLPALALPKIDLPATLRPGEPLLVWVRDEAGIRGGTAELHGPGGALIDSAALFEKRGPGSAGPGSGRLYGALFALSMDAKPGDYRIAVSGEEVLPGFLPAQLPAEGSVPSALATARQAQADLIAAAPPPAALSAFRVDAGFTLVARVFHSEDIALDAANTALLATPDPRKEAEAKALYALLGQVDMDAVWLDAGFVLPVDATRRTAGFGDRRRYLYAKGGSETSVHAGVDIAVPQRTPVQVCAAGRVVFSAPRIVTGNTVVVEHLPGLYSIYMHLSEAGVVQGQLLARGEVLGLSGSTGLSTGPHLHWELRLRGQAVDPDFWLSASPLDKVPPAVKMDGAIEGG